MSKFWYRPLAYFLATLGFFLGFTSKVLAQYGVWIASFRTMGTVTSETCSDVLPNIKVNIQDNNNNTVYETRTDAQGRFRIVLYDDYPNAEKNYKMIFTDTDGSENKGAFKARTTDLTTTGNETTYTLAFDGKNPCKDEPDNMIQNIVITSDTSLNRTPDIVAPSETPATSLSEPLNQSTIPDVIVYPNPNQGSFFVSFSLVADDNITINVFNSTGALVFTRVFLCRAGTHTEAVNPGDVAAGHYILSLSNRYNTITRHLIIKH